MLNYLLDGRALSFLVLFLFLWQPIPTITMTTRAALAALIPADFSKELSFTLFSPVKIYEKFKSRFKSSFINLPHKVTRGVY